MPQIITDPDKIPTTFNEAPALAALVAHGKLPPVKERLPEVPLVIQPTDEIGQYGGTWRSVFKGPGDRQNFERITNNSLVRWDAMVTKVVPNLIQGWKRSDDGRVFTLLLRKGLKWSDGEPFTAADIMFWYEDLYHNSEATPNPGLAWNADSGGVQGVWEKVNDYTVKVTFEHPYHIFLQLLSRQSHLRYGRIFGGPFAPKHYLKQFHPKYVGKEAADKIAKDAGYDNWVALMKFKIDPELNVECPATSQWVFEIPINAPRAVMRRNPYYHAVDTAGNQLPYIDSITFELVTDLEVLALRAAAGQYDIQARHITLDKLPVLVANRKRGNYHINLYPGRAGSDAAIYFNQSYHVNDDADPEIAKWLLSFEFRKAISQALDRDQLNEVFWLGMGTPGSVSPDPEGPYSPGPDWRKKYSTLDLKLANDILDGLGLDKRDRAGLRLRSDGKGPLTLQMMTTSSLIKFPQIGEMIADQIEKNVGIKIVVQQMERSLFQSRAEANDFELQLWTVTGNDIPWLDNTSLPVNRQARMGPLYGRWWETRGKKGEKPPGDFLRLLELSRDVKGVATEAGRVEVGHEMAKIMVNNLYAVGTVGMAPTVIGVWVVKNNVGNVPQRAMYSLPAQTPGHVYPEQFYFKP